MTYFEKLKLEHPEYSDQFAEVVEHKCPSHFKYETNRPYGCFYDEFFDCRDCWKREISEGGQ